MTVLIQALFIEQYWSVKYVKLPDTSKYLYLVLFQEAVVNRQPEK